MKTLYLVRHAKSSWNDPKLSDFERPLNKRGYKDAPLVAHQMKSKNVSPDLIISSPAARALITARYFAEILGIPEDSIITEAGIYEADSEDIIHVIIDTENTINSIMLFGHNPGITNCANQLTTESISNIVTTGVYCIRFNMDDWISIRKTPGTVIFYDYPKKFK